MYKNNTEGGVESTVYLQNFICFLSRGATNPILNVSYSQILSCSSAWRITRAKMAATVCFGARAAAGVSWEQGSICFLTPSRTQRAAAGLLGFVPAIQQAENQGNPGRGHRIWQQNPLACPPPSHFSPFPTVSTPPHPRHKKPHCCLAVKLTGLVLQQ